MYENNLCHLIVEPSHSYHSDHKSNRVVKMWWEFQWFKKIENILHTKFKEAQNSSMKILELIFSKNYQEFRKEGRDWRKKTITIFLVIDTLIISNMFSTTFNNCKEVFFFFAIRIAFITLPAFILLRRVIRIKFS